MPKPFSHLHTHSHYSLLYALPKVNELVKRAKSDGMTALALTDNGNLYGAIEFYKTCKKSGIKPIIGVDAYVAPRTRYDKEPRIDTEKTRLILLAKNLQGYKNLIKLVTDSYLQGFYYKPRIDNELIEKYKEGLIAITPSFTGDIALAIKNQNIEKANSKLNFLKNNFGDDFYIEITHHPEIRGHEENMKSLVNFARETNTQIVAGHDVYYLLPEDKKARDTLIAVQKNIKLDQYGEEDKGDFSFINQEQANEYFKDLPDALLNTQKIVESCNVELELGNWVFPEIEIPEGSNHNEELRKLVYTGIEKRAIEKTKEVLDRVEYELKVISDKGYSPYFLVVADLLAFAHKNKILTTIRGSVAGSMVTYLAGITNVNPLEYNIPFERFLNPERPSAPDIDMDYADNRRDEMIQYAKDKYGADKVAQIGTFGTMMARGAVRDVARALGYPYALGDRIAKLIPFGAQGFPMTIDKAMEMVPELKDMFKKEPDVKAVIDMAKKIEGCARHISIHAAGVVISPKSLTEYVPLQFDPKGENKIITQFDMGAVEDAGLLKFDFLGIKNLSILADAVDRVRKIEGSEIDIENIPIDDKKTFEMLSRGETCGLFQLNGEAMTKFLIDLKPTNIKDINVMVALYRPGPMRNIPDYIARKHGKKKVTFLHPKMESYLGDTYGILVYQEDIMLTALALAGYTWKTVDKLRKAIGKKIPEEMAEQESIFIEGCQKVSGLSKEKAQQIWDLFDPFKGYGFNKAHAASYGKVAYQTAYMKANFPTIYMSAVLTADSGEIEKIAEFVEECKRMNIPVLPPDINESFKDFTVVKANKTDEMDKIRFGLTTIKNFGEGIAEAIILEREQNGKFKSLEDFLNRVHNRNLNKKSLEALIMCGAMDSFGERGEMLGNIEDILAYNKEMVKDSLNGDSLFAHTTHSTHLKLSPKEPASKDQKLIWEKELLGLYVSGHPLDKFKEKLSGKLSIQKIKNELRQGMIGVVSGIVSNLQEIITKKNEKMCFIKLSDFSGSIEVVVFPSILEQFKDIIKPDACISIKGKMSNRNDQISMIADQIKIII